MPFVDFEFRPRHERLIPHWCATRAAPWQGRITRAALAQMRGPIPDDMPASAVFREVSDWVTRIAGDKLVTLRGAIDGPLTIDVDDLWWARLRG